MHKVLTATAMACWVLAAAPMTGCASNETATREAPAQSDYRTGSNIPRKDRSGDTVKTVDPNSIQAPLPPISRPPAGSGGG